MWYPLSLSMNIFGYNFVLKTYSFKFVYFCSELVLNCTRLYLFGSFGLKHWTIVSIHGNLVPTNVTSQRDYKPVPLYIYYVKMPI